MPAHRGQDVLCSDNVVVDEFPLNQPADLCLVDHNGIGSGKGVRPGTVAGEIRFHNVNLGMQPTQHPRVGRMLVYPDEFDVRLFLQSRDEVLSDQSCGTRDHDFHVQISMRLKTRTGRFRMISMAYRQNHGA